MSRRVVVTGVGLAAASGVGWRTVAATLESGACCLTRLDGRLGDLVPGAGGRLDLPMKDFGRYFDTKVLRTSTMTRQTTLGCLATGDLLQDGGLPPDGALHPDRGAYLGSFIVPPDFAKQARAAKILSHRPEGKGTGFVLDDRRLGEAMKMASAFDFLRALPNMPSSHLSIQCGYQGPACTYLGSDAAGLQAVGFAAHAVEEGLADVMIAGGAFCPFQEVHLAWQAGRGLWAEAGIEAARRVLPFGPGRTGTLPGEAGAMLLLEEEGHAVARGARILAEVLGFGQRFGLPGGNEGEMHVDVLRAALPGGTPDWVGPMALGHGGRDAAEDRAYQAAFGDLSGSGAVSVTASLGYSGPASGPLQLIAALLAARGELRQPVLPVWDLDCSTLGPAVGRPGACGPGAVILASTFSPDGVHAAIALRAR